MGYVPPPAPTPWKRPTCEWCEQELRSNTTVTKGGVIHCKNCGGPHPELERRDMIPVIEPNYIWK